MTHTVTCPECHGPATVLGQFSIPVGDRQVEYVRIRCAGPLALLVPVDEVRAAGRQATLP